MQMKNVISFIRRLKGQHRKTISAALLLSHCLSHVSPPSTVWSMQSENAFADPTAHPSSRETKYIFMMKQLASDLILNESHVLPLYCRYRSGTFRG